jgi:hypothetical protein
MSHGRVSVIPHRRTAPENRPSATMSPTKRQLANIKRGGVQTDRLREFRQTTQCLTDYRRERGTLDSAREFFRELDRRIATNPGVLDDPVPAIHLEGSESTEDVRR